MTLIVTKAILGKDILLVKLLKRDKYSHLRVKAPLLITQYVFYNFLFC